MNLLGNKFFALTFTFALGQTAMDSLGGQKIPLHPDGERLLGRTALRQWK